MRDGLSFGGTKSILDWFRKRSVIPIDGFQCHQAISE